MVLRQQNVKNNNDTYLHHRNQFKNNSSPENKTRQHDRCPFNANKKCNNPLKAIEQTIEKR